MTCKLVPDNPSRNVLHLCTLTTAIPIKYFSICFSYTQKLTQSYKRHKNSWRITFFSLLHCLFPFMNSMLWWLNIKYNIVPLRPQAEPVQNWLPEMQSLVDSRILYTVKNIYFNVFFGLFKVYLLWTWVCEVVMLSVANRCSTLNYRKNDLTSIGGHCGA